MNWDITAAHIWIALGLVLMLLEFGLTGFFAFFFGLAALTTGVVVMAVDLGINAQLALFTALSVVYLVALRRVFQRVFRGRLGSSPVSDQLNQDGVGETAMVVSAIIPPAAGLVEFRGTQWQARATVAIAAGSTARITGRESIVLRVEPFV
jgi:inner membrane protein